MKLNKTQWLMALAFSGVLLTSCHQQAVKPSATVANAASAIESAVIRKSPNDDRTYAAILLPNQLQVVLVSDPTLENSAASLAVGVGSAQDPESQPGLAHYLEHMLFLGTKKYPVPDNFMEFVDNNAGSTNAFTAFDQTNFLFEINAEKFDEALDRYSDYFKSPLLDPQYADKERNAVNSEWSMNKSQDHWILHTLDGITGNQANPASRFSIGNLETLADKKDSKLQDEVKAFYNRYYSANIMRLTLVGKQSIPELKALAEKYFADIPNKNVIRPQVTTPGLTKAELGKSIHYQPQKDLKQLFIDFPIKDDKALWRVKPNEYVNNLIGSEENGTLCQQLRKAGLVNIITTLVSADEYGDDGYLRIAVDLTDAGLKNRDQVIASVFSYIDLVKKQGLNERYFKELKAVREKDFLNQSKLDPLKQAVSITHDQFYFPVENLLDYESVYDRFDEKAIQAVLDQLQSDNARIWYISKNENVDKTIQYFDGKYSIRDIQAEEKARWAVLGSKFAFNLPPVNNLFTDKPADIVDNKFLKPHQVVSEKGIEIFLTNPEFYREDKGQLEIELNVNFAQKSARNVVLSYLVSDIYKVQNTTLIDRADRASLGVAVTVSPTGSQMISISGYTTKHEELLSQLLSGFANFNVSDKDFIDALDRYKKSKLNLKKAIPIRQAFGHTSRLLRKAQWTDAQLIAEADKISVKDIIQYQKSIKDNLLIRVYAFGNYDEAAIKHMAQSMQTYLPGKRMPSERQVAQYITPKVGKNISFKDHVEQADSALVDVSFGDHKSDDDRAQLVVLDAIFGNALFSQLRTNEQMGYVVGSLPIVIDEYSGFAFYVQSTNTDLVGIKARMDRFRTEFLEQLKAIDPAQIEQIKKSETAKVLQKPTDFYKEASRYSVDFWAAHFNFDARERYLAALARVSKENIIALYQKRLLEHKSMNIVVQLQGENFKGKPFAPLKP